MKYLPASALKSDCEEATVNSKPHITVTSIHDVVVAKVYKEEEIF